MSRDLIVSAQVYRNGGTGEFTHLCDDCLCIGLRAIKVEVDTALGEIDTERHDKQIDELTQQLGTTQHTYKLIAHDHNRMQTRLKTVLLELDKFSVKETDDIKYARWEASREPAKDRV